MKLTKNFRMRSYRILICRNRINKVPHGIIKGYLFTGILAVIFLFLSICAAFRTFDKLPTHTIYVNKAFLVHSGNKLGSQVKLELSSNEGVFYLWYPSNAYPEYADKIRGDILSNEVTEFSIKYVSTGYLRDLVSGKKRIVDLRTKSTVYYDINTEILYSRKRNIGAAVVLSGILLIWLVSLALVLVVYNVIRFVPKNRT